MNPGGSHPQGHEGPESAPHTFPLPASGPPCRRGSTARSWKSRRAAGFTLLEVVLALSLAIGLLAVALVFYQQSARLRDQTLADAAALSAVRLTMDRLATELHTATLRPGTFRGGPHELEFLRCPAPDPAASVAGTVPPGAGSDRFPLRRLRYRLAGADTNALENATGLERIDEAAEPTSAPDATPSESDLVSTDDTPEPTGESASATVTVAVTSSVATVSVVRLLIPELRYFALRYWDGLAWQESWDGPGLPLGVEIGLATEAPPATAPAGTLPLELFRRVVALPTAFPTDPVAATNTLELAADRREWPTPAASDRHHPRP